MSGLEVAGIVLGALPLIISALEHYAQGVSTAKRFWHFKSELRFLLLRINTEKVTFVNTLEHLLTGIVRIDRMAEMLANVGGQDWQDETIEQCLKDRLRGAYEVYLANVQGMAGALQKIMDKLALGPDGKVSHHPYFLIPSAARMALCSCRRMGYKANASEPTLCTFSPFVYWPSRRFASAISFSVGCHELTWVSLLSQTSSCSRKSSKD